MEKKSSRLHIDSKHRIFLTDYNNLEIEMTALQKTVFIFLLKHPEGVYFKELYKSKQELLRIYSKISNRADMEQLEKSILDITNARSNSINENCSRIKEAFLSKLQESIANNYFVTGSRSNLKLIKLDRALVSYESIY